MSEIAAVVRQCEQRVVAAVEAMREQRISLLDQPYALSDGTEGQPGVPRLSLREVVGLVLREAGVVKDGKPPLATVNGGNLVQEYEKAMQRAAERFAYAGNYAWAEDLRRVLRKRKP